MINSAVDESTQETTDEEILSTVLTMNGNNTSDEDEEDILVSNSEATSAMKIGEVKLFLKANKLKPYKQSTINRFLNKE